MNKYLRGLNNLICILLCSLATIALYGSLLALFFTPQMTKLFNEYSSKGYVDLTAFERLEVNRLAEDKFLALKEDNRSKYSSRVSQAYDVINRLPPKRNFIYDDSNEIDNLSKVVAYEHNLCEIANIQERISCERDRERTAKSIAHDVYMINSFGESLAEIYEIASDKLNSQPQEANENLGGTKLFLYILIILNLALLSIFTLGFIISQKKEDK